MSKKLNKNTVNDLLSGGDNGQSVDPKLNGSDSGTSPLDVQQSDGQNDPKGVNAVKASVTKTKPSGAQSPGRGHGPQSKPVMMAPPVQPVLPPQVAQPVTATEQSGAPAHHPAAAQSAISGSMVPTTKGATLAGNQLQSSTAALPSASKILSSPVAPLVLPGTHQVAIGT